MTLIINSKWKHLLLFKLRVTDDKLQINSLIAIKKGDKHSEE